jgi:uncharacterized membrane protein YqhA
MIIVIIISVALLQIVININKNNALIFYLLRTEYTLKYLFKQ